MIHFLKELFNRSPGRTAEPVAASAQQDAFSSVSAMAPECERCGISEELDALCDAYQDYQIARLMLEKTPREEGGAASAEAYIDCAHEVLLKTSAFVTAATTAGINARSAVRDVIALVYRDLKARKFE